MYQTMQLLLHVYWYFLLLEVTLFWQVYDYLERSFCYLWQWQAIFQLQSLKLQQKYLQFHFLDVFPQHLKDPCIGQRSNMPRCGLNDFHFFMAYIYNEKQILFTSSFGNIHDFLYTKMDLVWHLQICLLFQRFEHCTFCDDYCYCSKE